MKNFRKYGTSPFSIVVLHGGPGGIGSVAPVAEKLSEKYSILEPFETKTSIDGQIEELKEVIETQADSPVTLIGHSWGAWLGVLLTAKYPTFVKKLILVSSAPFEEHYAENIHKTRMSRLDAAGKEQAHFLIEKLQDPITSNEEIKPFFQFMAETDSYKPQYDEVEQTLNLEIFRKVWEEAVLLRKNGKLLTQCAQIKCPVIAIHGDYDPHPYQGVQEPLSLILKDFTFVLLKHCGHTPWIEKEAADKFYEVLKKYIGHHDFSGDLL